MSARASLALILGFVASVAGSGCMDGSCGDELGPIELVDGVYLIEEGPNGGVWFRDGVEVRAELDVAAGTLVLTYTEDGVEWVETYELGPIEVERM